MPPAGGVKSCRSGKHARFFETTCDVLTRQLLKDGEEFDHNRAHELLAAPKMRKSPIHCKLRCETKSMKIKRASTFGTQPPRKIYPYRDIVHHYSFSSDPSILILACLDEEHQCRYYEFLKLQPQHVNEVCDLLTRARYHPEFILTDETNYPNQFINSQPILNATTEHPQRPLDENKEMQESIKPDINQSLMAEPTYGVTHSEDLDGEDLVATINGSPDLEIIEPVHAAHQNQKAAIPESELDEHPSKPDLINHDLFAQDELYKKLCRNVKSDDLWAIDLKYIESHPNHGNRIADTGGVYLFIAHHRIPEQQLNSINHHNNTGMDDTSSMEYDPMDAKSKTFNVKNTAEPEITMAYF